MTLRVDCNSSDAEKSQLNLTHFVVTFVFIKCRQGMFIQLITKKTKAV